MTILEQRFLEIVPIMLKQIAEELKAINETLKKEKEDGTEV